MKKIIPFSNDIKFNTKIYEITSISLEHNLNIESNNIITGEFVVSGDYKMNDTSINTEPFIHGLPFDITLDTKYDMDRIKIDIDDFKFEIINEEILRVNIDVLIEGSEIVEIEEEEKEEEIKPDLIIDSRKKEEIENEEDEENIEMRDNMDEIIINDLFKQDKEDIKMVMSDNEPNVSNIDNISKNNAIGSIFDNFSEKDEKYVTYYVHIVRDNDNIDSICMKYNVTKEILKEYNNIEQITLGTKVIVPYIENETV